MQNGEKSSVFEGKNFGRVQVGEKQENEEKNEKQGWVFIPMKFEELRLSFKSQVDQDMRSMGWWVIQGMTLDLTVQLPQAPRA